MTTNTSEKNEHTGIQKRKRGEMIAVCSAKGGVGRTIMTVNLAVALCKKSIKVGVLDGDYMFGDVGLAMDLQSAFTVKDVIEDIDDLDEVTLESYFSRHESGVRVLSAPDRPEYSELVTKENISKILDLMLSQFDYVVVDTGVGLQEQTLPLLEKADQILMLTNLEMSTLKNTKLMLETLDAIELNTKVTTVVNRSTMESVISASDVPDILEDPELQYIPNDFQIASQSLNIGIPFVVNQGKTELAKAVMKIAEQLTSRREIKVYESAEPSFLSKIFQRSKRSKEGKA
ncbi:AAA family ATPase [Pseudalkalibacillus salsuginis]|uniref:AAA family ATPase n=1 Tax=Pseudalkalibacillus salsuginis TaxID=2910972 RepID=UPI001F1BB848|nr:AAA family ATPase [Pseudalkalibacillus salsuginis]MCF6411246.1 AAA family ATPase [Pseudalkalibacillus salsuginis]